MSAKLSSKQKKEIRNQLYERDGKHCHYCHYCGIKEENFTEVWGEIYGGNKRGRTLEIDHKDNNQGNDLTNFVLACAICNIAKSDKFTYDEFLKVGKVIEGIWQNRWRNMKGKTVK